MSKPETILSANVAKVFDRLGCIVVRIQSGTIPVPGRRIHCAKIGTPDRVVLFPNGVTRWLEIKLPGQKLRPEQTEWRTRAERLGHVVDVITSVEDAIALAREAMGANSHVRG